MSGIGAAAEEKLHSRGIRTLGQLADADEGMLLRAFGKNGRVMHVRANGGDDAPVEQDDTVKSVSNEMTFAVDLTTREDVEGAIATIAAKVGRRLRRKGLRGRTLGLRMRYDDRSVRSVQRQLPAPSDDELSYTPLLYRMADELWRPGMPVRLIGVAMTGFGGGESVQDSLFDIAEAAPSDDDVDPVIKDEAKRRGLIEATDLVKDKFGESAVRFGRQQEPGRLQVDIIKAKPDASDMQPRTLRESQPEEVGAGMPRAVPHEPKRPVNASSELRTV